MSIAHTLGRSRRYTVNDATSTTTPVVAATVNGWAARVVAGGGLYPSASTISTLSTFTDGLIQAGLYSKMANINCMVPDNLVAACTPLIATTGYGSTGTVGGSWVNVGFITSDLSISGLKGDASSYLKTGVIVANISANDFGMTLYSVDSDTSNKNDFGAVTGGTGTQLLVNYSGTSYFDCYNGTTGRISGVPITNGQGYASGNRTSAVSESLYKASSAVTHVQVAGPGGASGTPTATNDLWAFCLNNAGSPFGQTAKRFSFMGVHNGLTATESSTFFTLIHAMRTSLGGGYI